MQFWDSVCPPASSVSTPAGVSGRAREVHLTTPFRGSAASQYMVRRFTGNPAVWGRRRKVAEGSKKVEASWEMEYPCTLEKKELPMFIQTDSPNPGSNVVSTTSLACMGSPVILPSTRL